MSERMTMTRDEFEAYINESFDNGSLAALGALSTVIAELRNRVTAAASNPPAPEASAGVGEGVG